MALSVTARLTPAANNILFLSVASLLAAGFFMLPGKPGNSYQSAAPLAAVAAPDCAKAKGIAKVACLADNFKAMLSAEQLAKLQLPYSKADAQKWSNLPATFPTAKRIGIKFGDLTPEQLQAAMALLKEVSGTTANEGYDEMQQLRNADDYLALKKSSDYGSGHFYMAFLGMPSASGTFEIQYGGHHTAFANTYKDGVLIGATPSFRGAEPFGKFEQNGRSNEPMVQEHAAFAAILASLTPEQQQAARLTNTFRDVVLGPNKDGQFPTTPLGIKCSTLSSAQKKLVLAAINTYTDDIDEKDAAPYLKKYTKELDNTYLSFTGTTDFVTRNDYVRLDGPSLWIEYVSQNGVVYAGIHPHSVWRDKTNDYGGN
ncbi:DUF3500 domain-containing protein [Mucilaginibacter sp. HD30]